VPDSPTPIDLTMECLARLRCEPHGNAIEDIAHDMGIHVDGVRDLLADIKARGFHVVHTAEGRKWFAAIAVADWPRAERMAAAYLELREATA
jgi:hypothetical protein